MKRWLALLCVRRGWLPKDPRFVRFIRAQLFVHLHPRDQAAGMTGYFDLGDSVTQQQARHLRDWWQEVGGE